LATIPVFGGTAAEILSLVLEPPVTRRRDDWLRELAEAVDGLKAKVDGFKIEDLANNEAFVSAAIQATRIAVSTHQATKREMLRNALLNVAAGTGPQEDLQEVFIAAIETLSPTHMKVLKFLWTGLTDLDKAGLWNSLHPYALGNYSTAIGQLYPDLKGQDDLLSFVMTDLHSRGFSKVARPGGSFAGAPAVTNMGIEFLRFVLEPPK